MRKFGIFSLIFVTCWCLILAPIGCFAAVSSNGLGLSAHAFALIDEFGDILFENNAHTRLPMASTTKIMTALVALDHLDPEQSVSIPKEAVGVEGSSAYFIEGERLKVLDLLHALLLQSANDSALALAITVSENVQDFCALMNEKASELGLDNTHFDNPHGLDSKDHYTTAYELAVITARAFDDPMIAMIMGTKKYTCTSEQGNVRTFVNHNRLLSSYEYCVGGKTGYTKADGRCLASVAENNGVRLIATTLNAPNDWDDHRKLYRAGFAMYNEQKLCDALEFTREINVVGGNTASVICQNPASVYAYVRQNCEISAVWELAEFEYAPIICGQSVGRVVFLQNGNEIAFAELVAQNEVCQEKKEEKLSIWDKVIKFFKKIFAAIFQ